VVSNMDDDASELIRYWFAFDVSDLAPPKTSGITLDGGTRAFRLCGNGVGVTGFNRQDCIDMVEARLGGEPLPPISAEIRDVDVSQIGSLVGVPVWRGIWSPALNMKGPERT
jgi:hypothetical protein